MLTVKVLFYRKDKAPVTLESKRIDSTNEMTIRDMHEEAEKFYHEFMEKYPSFKNVHDIGYHFDLRY